ncbi:MAG: hypothetical protein IJ403_01610 [Oscillospiraceae bacterium]|nr:hypothetical protein [Oscillospiraceae bacterium]
MAKQIEKLNYQFKYKDRTIEGVMRIDLGRFEGQYSRAQYQLDSMVMDSMVPYMPMQTSIFINVTRGMSQSIAGSGKVVAAAPPMGGFLYEGKVMIGERTLSAFAAKAEKKIVTERDLQYSRHAHPNVTDHWFDTAKKYHGKVWVRKTKKMAGGG